MDKHGSNIKSQHHETKDTTDISGSAMEKNEDQFITPEDTRSPKSNSGITNPSEIKSDKSQSIESEQPWLKELQILKSSQLPDREKGIAAAALDFSHFSVWIPNSVASVITIDSIIELPPGSVLVLVFQDTPDNELPNDYQTGQPYLITDEPINE